jgi:hypothetical protein
MNALPALHASGFGGVAMSLQEPPSVLNEQAVAT